MVSSIVVQYTDLLRTGEYDLWRRLRELLQGQGLDPDRTVVVDLLQEGPDHEDGQVISADGRVFKFSPDHGLLSLRAPSRGWPSSKGEVDLQRERRGWPPLCV
ncbi:hypothetical protein [Streptomyces mirabilis]